MNCPFSCSACCALVSLWKCRLSVSRLFYQSVSCVFVGKEVEGCVLHALSSSCDEHFQKSNPPDLQKSGFIFLIEMSGKTSIEFIEALKDEEFWKSHLRNNQFQKRLTEWHYCWSTCLYMAFVTKKFNCYIYPLVLTFVGLLGPN